MQRNQQMNYSLIIHIFILVISISCSNIPKKRTKGGVGNIIDNHMRKNSSYENESESISGVQLNKNSEVENSADSQEEMEEESLSSIEDMKVSSINVVENAEVNKWVQYFSVKDRERFQRMLNRGEPLREVVQGILAENGLPKELYYLGLIESGYVNHARSHANAVGVWQFIKGTGQRYGLQMNNYVDERQDPIRATEAAARYLRGLYNVFQSWELVMSAYNCGEYRVLGSVMKTGIRDYWKLTNKGYLPRETRDYVPKFMAAVMIGLDPEKYGFKVEITEGTDYPNLELVEVSSPISLAKIAQTVGMSLSELRRFNPHLHKGITPPGRGRYEVWIPQKQSKVFANELAQLAPEKGSYKTYAAVEKETQTNKNDSDANGISSAQIHIVKRGENLAIIAAKYNQTISHLRNINGLTNTKIRSGQRLRLMAREYHAPKTRYHQVRNGENLTTIARFYGTTVPKLKQLNRLSKGSIQRGQKLLVSGQVSNINEEISNNNKSIYRVRKGDTLESIAERFGTTIANLRKINRLKGPSIFVGQSLTIKKNSSSI